MFFLDKLFDSNKNSPDPLTPKATPTGNEGTEKDTSFFSDLYEGAKNKAGPIVDKLSDLAEKAGKEFDKIKEDAAKTINDLTRTTDVIQTETQENLKRDWVEVDLSKDTPLEAKPLSAEPAPSFLDNSIEKE